MLSLFRFLIASILLLPSLSLAAIEAYEFKDAKTEATYYQLVDELRCLVCQNQNLAGSDADLAKDLRRQTYEMLIKGNSADQVIEYMVERYGDFVLYRPLFKTSTLVLWLGPFMITALFLFLLLRRLRRKQVLEEPDSDALQRARQLLSETPAQKNTDQ